MADFYPAASGDDGHSKDGGFENNTNYVNLGNDGGTYYGKMFFRFPGVTIPDGLSIFTATLTLTAYANLSAGPPSVSIYFNDVDDAVAPTSKGELDGLALTDEVVEWNVPSTTTDSEYTTPDFSAVLQEVMDREGWVSGQDIQLVMSYNTSAIRKWYAIDYDSGSKKAKLSITYGSISTKDFTSTPLAATSELTFVMVISGDPALNLSGDLALTLPSLTFSATGTSRSGSLNLDLPALSMELTGSTGSTGYINLVLPKLQFAASGVGGDVGSVEFNLPSLAVSFAGYTNIPWKFDLTLPSLRVMFSGGAVATATAYAVILMNTKNLAVSEYDWSGFNSFAYFNGEYIGAKSTGIHLLEGDQNNGLPIDSIMSLGQIPVGANKPRDVYILGRASGLMALVITSDEDTEKEVTVPYLLETLYEARAKIPRGIDPIYFSLELKNKNGSDFDIDEIQVYGEGHARKKS